jgi:C-terminal processing protease CtpA/Prc
LEIARGKKELDLNEELKNREREAKYLAKNREEIFNVLGAEFEDVERDVAKKLEIDGGVRVKKLYPGKLTKHTEIREGFIITKVDGQLIKNTEELAEALESKKGGVLIEGVYEDLPGKYYYAFGL